mmetsp:Transcript_25393/g.70681  ORF Transcript_25393/g.70681 Transcript_25393/m.70681 type:complete len:315 (+) Transcript_25393:433-1377(+)
MAGKPSDDAPRGHFREPLLSKVQIKVEIRVVLLGVEDEWRNMRKHDDAGQRLGFLRRHHRCVACLQFFVQPRVHCVTLCFRELVVLPKLAVHDQALHAMAPERKVVISESVGVPLDRCGTRPVPDVMVATHADEGYLWIYELHGVLEVLYLHISEDGAGANPLRLLHRELVHEVTAHDDEGRSRAHSVHLLHSAPQERQLPGPAVFLPPLERGECRFHTELRVGHLHEGETSLGPCITFDAHAGEATAGRAQKSVTAIRVWRQSIVFHRGDYIKTLHFDLVPTKLSMSCCCCRGSFSSSTSKLKDIGCLRLQAS